GKHNHSEDGSDNNSIPNGVNSDDEEVQDTFQSDVNVATREETPGEKRPTKVQEDSLSGDPFGLEDLIRKSSKKGDKVVNVECDSDPKFPPGFTPQNYDHLEEVAANSPTSDRAFVDHTSVQDKGVVSLIISWVTMMKTILCSKKSRLTVLITCLVVLIMIMLTQWPKLLNLLMDSVVPISHLLYTDDVMFIGKWSSDNVNVLMMLHWFFLA
ncbi:hypothetical protein Tco_0172198, partial [Tanacetum coccineum]